MEVVVDALHEGSLAGACSSQLALKSCPSTVSCLTSHAYAHHGNWWLLHAFRRHLEGLCLIKILRGKLLTEGKLEAELLSIQSEGVELRPTYAAQNLELKSRIERHF